VVCYYQPLWWVHLYPSYHSGVQRGPERVQEVAGSPNSWNSVS